MTSLSYRMTKPANKEIDDYKVITITHKTTSIQRLKDYFVDDDIDPDYPQNRLHELKASFQMDELLYLNTCNRVSFFFTSKRKIDHHFLSDLFHFINPSFKEDLIEKHADVTKVYEGKAALDHFFSVSASLDSLIVGEREILGQIKEAYSNSKKYELSGDSIRLAIEQTIVLAKRIYHETRIGEKPVSVVSLAFRQLLEHIPHKDTGILMIGAGQSNQLIANLLKKYGFNNVHIFNRTLDKAQELATKLKGRAYSLNELASFKEEFSIVISCTGSKDYVLTKELFDGFESASADLHYTILDLAVPEDVDPAIMEAYKVHYLNIESLEAIASKNLAFRQTEVVKAKEILTDFVVDFDSDFKQRQLELALIGIPNEVKALKSKAMNEVFEKDIENLDDNAKEVLSNIMDYFEKKYIGIPMKIAKKTILGRYDFKS